MQREFVMAEAFEQQWKNMGLTDNDLNRLQQEILDNPKIGKVIPGTGRLRKMRFAFEGQGKRGSARVTYVDFLMVETIYLIYAYTKGEKDNLTKKQANDFKKIIEALERALEQEV